MCNGSPDPLIAKLPGPKFYLGFTIIAGEPDRIQ